MAAYCSRSDIDTLIPANVLKQALDDDADGVEDSGLADLLLEAASRTVDGLLCRTTALDLPYPYLAVRAAVVFACWLIYQRKGNSPESKNPWQGEKDKYETHLGQVAAGKLSLTAAPSAAGYAGNITEPENNFHDVEGI